MLSITITELRNHLRKYLTLSKTEDIYISRHGKVIAKLSNPNQNKIDIANSLFGILPDTMTLEESIEDRLNHI